MKLRVLRTYKWEDTINTLVAGRHRPNYKLVSKDILQCEVNGVWENVPIVESPMPEHPDKIRREKESETLKKYKNFNERLK